MANLEIEAESVPLYIRERLDRLVDKTLEKLRDTYPINDVHKTYFHIESFYRVQALYKTTFSGMESIGSIEFEV